MDGIELDDLHKEKKEVLNNKIKPHLKKNRMGYIKVPTGWGKTFLAKHLMKKYYQDGKIVLFLVSGNNQLLEQTYIDPKSNKPLYPNSILLSGDAKEKQSPEKLLLSFEQRTGGVVVFASLQTINRKDSKYKDILIQNTDIAIIDEIHNFIDNNGNKFIDELKDETKVFGMTATPFQGVVGNVKFVDEISADMNEIYNKTLPQCIMDRELSELNYIIIRNNQSILDVFNLKSLSELNKQDLFIDCSEEKINSVIQRTYLAKKIYDEKIKNKKSKTLIFCAPARNVDDGQKKVNVFHAKLCSAIFNGEIKDKFDTSISFNNNFNNNTESGQFKNAVYISSKSKERDKIINAFKTPEKPPFVLCTVGMLIEGFDFPKLENLILLRPTLSMRLFEQQVGRVTRKADNKKWGNIFEIADDIDTLYDNFGYHIFKEKTFERIQMLQPENRIEELFTEGENIEAIVSKKIKITDIEFKGLVNEFEEHDVPIPPTSLRAKRFSKWLLEIEKGVEGEFKKEKVRLLEMAIRFKINNIGDAKEVSKLITLLDRLEQEAKVDSRLGVNCRKHKPQVFNEIKWLLKLRALTYLKCINKKLNSNKKNEILEGIGFEKDYEKIDEFRLECLEEGTGRKINKLFETLKRVKNFEKTWVHWGVSKQQWKKEFKPLVYWASCFTVDHPEFKKLFESKDWNDNVKKYVIK